MKGVFGVAVKPQQPPPPAKPPIDTSDLVSLTSVGTFDHPVLVTAPRGDGERASSSSRPELVGVVRGGVAVPVPFLDI